jgi:hypothetical protein
LDLLSKKLSRMGDVIGYTITFLFAINVATVIYCIGLELASIPDRKSIIYNIDGSINHEETNTCMDFGY